MKKIMLVIIILAMFLAAGCAQQPSQPINPPPSTEESTTEEPEQICTKMWICTNENAKAYRKSDCTFEQITDCPAGCENGECKKVAQEPKAEESKQETKEEPKIEDKEGCTIGWKCLDDKRLGYQSSNCMFDNVDECQYGCKDGACIKTAPEEKPKEEIFSLTEGKLTMNISGWKFFDFSKEQISREINDYDVKIKLYASASGYNYYRAESYRSDLWIIEKGMTEATRPDCIEKMVGANAYLSLKSGQTLCLETKEKNIALIGGYWVGLPKEDTELTWKYYIPK